MMQCQNSGSVGSRAGVASLLLLVIAGATAAMHSSLQYAVGGRTLPPVTVDGMVQNYHRQGRLGGSTALQAMDDDPQSVPLTKEIPHLMERTPMIILATICAIGGFVAATQRPVHNAPSQLRDPKGVMHAFRVHQAKDRESKLTEILRDHADRSHLAAKKDGAVFRFHPNHVINHERTDPIKAAHLAVASAGAAAVVMNSQGEQFKDRLKGLAATVVTTGEGSLSELHLNSVYESMDEDGNWWPIFVESKNDDGSYSCRVAAQDDLFSGYSSNSNWPQVWASRCRKVRAMHAVVPEYSSQIVMW